MARKKELARWRVNHHVIFFLLHVDLPVRKLLYELDVRLGMLGEGRGYDAGSLAGECHERDQLVGSELVHGRAG